MKNLILFFFLIPTFVSSQKLSKPEKNFESFWRTFDKHYAHFESRKVNWKEQYTVYRPKVNANTSDNELLDVINQMIDTLKDGHVSISPSGDLPASIKYSSFYKKFSSREAIKDLDQTTIKTLKSLGFSDFKRFDSDRYEIGGYMGNKDYGYLKLTGFGGLPLQRFNEQLDSMVIAFRDKKAIIIDIRCNTGGYPEYVSEVAGRFIDKKMVCAFGQKKRGKTKFSPLKKHILAPHGQEQLVKPIVLITNSATISAADHFAMYLRELPYVRLVGENTNGIFSSMMGRKLPNGWQYSLSNERYFSAKHRCYEGIGVPVDVKAENETSDLTRNFDPVMDTAIKELNSSINYLKSKCKSYEAIAFACFIDSILNKLGSQRLHISGKVEEETSLVHPFIFANCKLPDEASLKKGLLARSLEETQGDSLFFTNDIRGEFYVDLGRINAKMHPKHTKRNMGSVKIYQDVEIANVHFVRMDITSGWSGTGYLIALNEIGKLLNISKISYSGINYVSRN